MAVRAGTLTNVQKVAWRALTVAALCLATACGGEPEEQEKVAPAPPLPSQPTTSVRPAAGPVVMTAAGDFDNVPETTGPVLEGMGKARADVHLALGDFSYDEPGTEQEWCDFVTSRVGDTPFELLAGNHDVESMDAFTECLPDGVGAQGHYGTEYFFDLPRDAPLVRVVMISPNLELPEGKIRYREGDDHTRWLTAALDGAESAGIPWTVVGTHKPCLSIGDYGCEIGQDLMDLLVEEQVDLVLAGHEHNYQRTAQLATGEGCPSVTAGSFDADCVADEDDTLQAGRGTVFVTAGTGGVDLRDVYEEDAEAGYFRAWSGFNSEPTHGFARVEATRDRLDVAFVPAAGEGFTDQFVITRP